MAITRKDRIRKARRTQRVRSSLKKFSYPRVSIFRSLNHIYGQIIDDATGETLVSASSLNLKNEKSDKKNIAEQVGKNLATLAKEKGIDRAILDRGPYLFHGRVKAFTQGLRDGGINI